MMKEKFLQTVKEYDMFRPGERVLVAVSGGADSIALLNLLKEAEKELRVELHVAHLNHMIRRGDAELDQEFVGSLARSLSLPITFESVDVPAYAREEKIGLEVAAREMRYEFFEKIARKIGAAKIAVGHTADDNIETFLMRLLRGSGTKGLCGIPPKRGRIVRPLIKIWRKEIEKYVGSLKLVPRRDYTNYESKYLRNRIRMKMISQLKIYNLNIKEILLNTILLLTEDSQYLERETAQYFKEVLESLNPEEIKLRLSKLKKLESPIMGHLLRHAIQRLKGDLSDISFTHIHDIMKSLNLSERWELHLPAGIYVFSNREFLIISREKPVFRKRRAYHYELSLPGEVFIREVGKRVKGKILEDVPQVDYHSLSLAQAYLDYNKVGEVAIVRNRKEGDRFSPLGMRGSKKLQDFFVDEKVSAEERDIIPIVESQGKIVWVAGMRMDDKFKITSQTKKVLRLELV